MMSLVDALEDERRETAEADRASSGRRDPPNPIGTPQRLAAGPSKSSARRSSQGRRTSPVPKGGLQVAHSTLGKKTRKKSASADAMAAIFGGTPEDFQVSARSKASGRHHSIAGIGQNSRSPSSALARSPSPGYGLLKSGRRSSMHLMMHSGNWDDEVKDSHDGGDDDVYADGPKNAISDTCLEDGTGHSRQPSGDSESDVRLQKDKAALDNAEGDDSESSEDDDEDEDEDAKSSDEEESKASTSGQKRGRRRLRGDSQPEGPFPSSEDSDGDQYASLHGQNKTTQRAKSLLADAEEERMARLKARLSPPEPAISIIGPGGERLVPKRGGVHPNTSYDYAVSGASSANSSDADVSDIKGAQKLSINMSHLDTSVSNRAVRTILRGDFFTMQEEGEEGLRRARLYLVATDLSDEAVYALEWTIGTILRDGDTMLAIYAVDEETGTGRNLDTDSGGSVQIGDGAQTAQDTMKAMSSQTEKMNQSRQASSLLTSSTYIPATLTDSRAGSVEARLLSKGELERQRAIEDISSTCVRLLRKTKLQVRVAVEVIHCKSPKHLITEAIDDLEPTLVILGSRGRSALKGVLLGSFSNYLVTKSSVPVMVARKRLRKHAKDKRTNIRLSNNLQRPNRLISAKID